MKRALTGIDATDVILGLARNQHGVVSRHQLEARGISDGLIDSRIANRRLTPVFPGVYGFGPGIVSQKGLWLAGTMTAGNDVVLSRRSAAMLWGLEVHFAGVEVVSLSMRTTRVRAYSERGLIVHQTRSLPAEHRTSVDGIPTTTLARTFVDLCATFSHRDIESLFNEADRRKILDIHELALAAESCRGRRGTGFLKTLLANRTPRNRLTRSELESRFLALCVEKGIRLPQVNVRVEGFEVDCFWPEEGLIIELDGRTFHSSSTSIESDRDRDSDLQLAGFYVARLTYRKVTELPEACAMMVQGHLRRAASLRSTL